MSDPTFPGVPAADCPDCAVTLALVQADGGARVCSCGCEYLPSPRWVPIARRRPEGPPAPQREAVYHADPDRWPTVAAPAQRPPAAEDPELVRVRGLLYALRPEREGPLGGTPDALPTVDAQPSPRRIVVQGGGGGSGLPAGLFAAAPQSPTLAVTERLCELDGAHPTEARTLRWLRHHGELRGGLVALYRAAGLALADARQREGWASTETARREGPRVVGRELVLRAADAWDGRAFDTGAARVLPSR